METPRTFKKRYNHFMPDANIWDLDRKTKKLRVIQK